MTSAIDRDGRTPLHHVAYSNDVKGCGQILDDGLVDPNLGDGMGFTALHLAAQNWSSDAARLLLERGVEVDPVNGYGNTPLFVAVGASRGRGDLIELLRSYGADPAHVNKAGQTPVGLARLIGNFNISQFFEDVADVE